MWAGLAVAIALSLGAAQPASTAGKLEAIRVEMEKGQGLYVSGDHAGAARVFEAGYQAYPYSAFLFNAGVCYQKLGDHQRALDKFREYLRVDPNAPDHDKVAARIASLEAALGQAPAGAGGEGQPGPAPVTTPPPVDDSSAMKSLVVIETEPAGAPLHVYARVQDNAAPFAVGAANIGWEQVAETQAPTDLTLDVGRYHVVVEKFRDFNVSQADIDVMSGHVHHFKANLSQGEFMAFLRVSANIQGAYVYIDDAVKKRPFWGTTPHGELVASGKRKVLVEAPGFEPVHADVMLNHGEQKEIELSLVRVGYGILRFYSKAPGIDVSIDGQSRGSWRSGEPPLDVKLPSGPHQCSVSSDGRKTYEGILEVPRGQVQPVEVKMIPTYPRGAAWTEAAIGAVFIGAGIYLGVESNHLYDDLEADRNAGVLEEDDSRVTKGRWFAIGANAGFAIGGALGALATYDFIKDPLPESSARLDALLEFEDPLKARPTAAPTPAPAPAPLPRSHRPPVPHALGVELGAGSDGLFLGGRF